MKRNEKPKFWEKNAVKNAERRFLREKKTKSELVNEICKAAENIFIMCVISALYDIYHVSGKRLCGVVEAAAEREERYIRTKAGLPRLVDGEKKTGTELAKLYLERDTAEYFPRDFVTPVYPVPKKLDAAVLYEQRMAVAVAARLYAYAMNKELGFGFCQVRRVVEEAAEIYRLSREQSDGNYRLLACKIGQIMRNDCDTDMTMADAAAFSDTLN